MRIAIVGAGAVGGTMAALLGRAGFRPTVIARGARQKMLEEGGLSFRSTQGDFATSVVVAEAESAGVQDILILAVKGQSLPQALRDAIPMIGPDTIVIPAVNGVPYWHFLQAGGPFDGRSVEAVDPGGALQALLPATQIGGCVLYLTAALDMQGVVVLSGAPRIVLGGLSPAVGAPLKAFAQALTQSGISTSVSTDIRSEVWAKLALNLATNPFSVVTGATLHDLFHRPDLVPTVEAILVEAVALARGIGVEPALDIDTMMAIGRRAGQVETSMLQDHKRGVALELAPIADAALELASWINHRMPVTAEVVTAVRTHSGQAGAQAPEAI